MNPESSRDADLAISGLRIWIEGRAFPKSEDYWDGNFLHVTATWAQGETTVTVRGPIIHLGELARLLDECEKLYASLSGQAELKCIEPNLGIVLKAKSLGHIDVRIQLTPDHMRESHEFHDSMDQTYLPAIVTSCTRIFEKYPIRQSDNGSVREKSPN
jgi:hypothetical protein